MKNTILASAFALAGVFGFAGAASAQSSVSTEVELTVNSGCRIITHDSLVAETMGFDGTTIGAIAFSVPTEFMVFCNENLPYTVETNASENGIILLSGQATGSTVPVQVLLGDHFDGVPFGQLANGEHYSGVGTGFAQDFQEILYFNSDGTEELLALPESDVYNGVLTRTVSW